MCVGGVDEVGAGPLAGPVVAACVVLRPERVAELEQVQDSKRLSPTRRAKLVPIIEAAALAHGLGVASVEEVDAMNVLQASRQAMRRAVLEVVDQLKRAGHSLGHLLVDAREVPDIATPQTAIIKGDQRVLSIAAASILAKEHRDAEMIAADARYPGYFFAKHKGYGTREHLDALEAHGPCALHRRSFAPVRRLLD